jgi:DNA polymerase/3'-5' exonuclease PolX
MQAKESILPAWPLRWIVFFKHLEDCWNVSETHSSTASLNSMTYWSGVSPGGAHIVKSFRESGDLLSYTAAEACVGLENQSVCKIPEFIPKKSRHH